MLRIAFLPNPACFAVLGALALGGAVPAIAQESAELEQQRLERSQQLESISADIEESREAEAELQAEIAGLSEDRAELNAELIGTAARIQDLEEAIGQAEERVGALQQREDALHLSLQDRRGLLIELLAALQRMGRQPPPAVLSAPEDALKAVRTAMLLGAVLPSVRIETEALASDLAEMARLKREIEAERSRLQAETRSLEDERVRIAALVEAKQRTIDEGSVALEEVRRRAAELAREAQSTEELIASLDREIAVAARETEEAPQESPSAQEVRGALSDPSRMRPAVAFSSAQGMLPKPASGAVIRTFGEADEFGSPSRGISLATRAGAQITSPADGWVVYAGPFRSYGELLILNAGDGYHVLLAGMERISVELGQFVLAGEPVGAMGELVVASTENVTVGRQQPSLYVEFRKDGRSIDPAPWWAEGRTGVGG